MNTASWELTTKEEVLKYKAEAESTATRIEALLFHNVFSPPTVARAKEIVKQLREFAASASRAV
jgi:hypothetical protein